MSDRPAAIVLAHGSLADGLVSAVQLISGRGARLMPLSNEGLSGADLAARLTAAMDATGARVIFTDLPAGSCNSAALRAIHGREGAVVVMGANLPALLHFAMHDELPPDAAARQAAARGLSVLKAHPAAPSAD
jgi:PTS system N-acetylgalactosamine-specific IIA component